VILVDDKKAGCCKGKRKGEECSSQEKKECHGDKKAQ
jgi:hypothetical protein